MLRALLGSGIVAVFLALSGPLTGQTFSWTDKHGGNWNDQNNWSDRTVPGAGQNAVIDLPGTYTVALTDDRSIAAVTINQPTVTLAQSAGELVASGMFTLQAGSLHLTGGRMILQGGLTTLTGTTIRIDGGTLFASPIPAQPVAINSTVEWLAGELHGPGSATSPFTLNAPVNLLGTGARRLQTNGIAELNANGTWDAGQLDLHTSSTSLRLAAGRTITNTTASGDFVISTAGIESIFDIRGSFIKQGTNLTEFESNSTVNNNGLIEVQGGRLRVMGRGVHTGVFEVANGAALEFGWANTLTAGRLTLNGESTLDVTASSTTRIESAVTVAVSPQSTIRVNLASLNLQTTTNLTPRTLEVWNARLTVRGNINTQFLTLGYDIQGVDAEIYSENTNTLSVSGSLTWTSGQIRGFRAITVSGPTDLPGTATRRLNMSQNSSMQLNGGGTWESGELRMNQYAKIVIPAGATILNTNASGNFYIRPPDATADGGSVVIQGTFIKAGSNDPGWSTTLFDFDVDVTNNGHLDIRGGKLMTRMDILSTGGGDYTLAAGTTLVSPSIEVRGAGSNTGVLQGEGTMDGTVYLYAGGRIRAGLGGPGVLTVGQGGFATKNVVLVSDAANPPRIVIAADRTGPGTVNAGRILVPEGQIDFGYTGSNGRLVEFEIVGTGLELGETYTLTVAIAAEGYRRNTINPVIPAGYEFAPSDFRLIHDFPAVGDVRLFLSDVNTLSLQFTPLPVPEPGTVLGLAAGVLAVGRLVRRRRL